MNWLIVVDQMKLLENSGSLEVKWRITLMKQNQFWVNHLSQLTVFRFLLINFKLNFIFDFQIYKHSLHKHKAWALFFQSWSFNFRFFFIKLYTFQSFYDHCIGNSFNVSMTFFENSELNFIDVLGSSSSVHVLFSWNFLN